MCNVSFYVVHFSFATVTGIYVENDILFDYLIIVKIFENDMMFEIVSACWTLRLTW